LKVCTCGDKLVAEGREEPVRAAVDKFFQLGLGRRDDLRRCRRRGSTQVRDEIGDREVDLVPDG
jgi:hypothetical protein